MALTGSVRLFITSYIAVPSHVTQVPAGHFWCTGILADEDKERVQARKEAPEMQCANTRGVVSVQREHREPVDVNVVYVLYGEFVIPENIPEQVHQE